MAIEAEGLAGSDSELKDEGSEKCSCCGKNWVWFVIIIVLIILCLFAYWSMV
jgi:hypothetical protein